MRSERTKSNAPQRPKSKAPGERRPARSAACGVMRRGTHRETLQGAQAPRRAQSEARSQVPDALLSLPPARHDAAWRSWRGELVSRAWAHLEAEGDVGAGDAGRGWVSRGARAHDHHERDHAACEAEVQVALPREARVRRRRHRAGGRRGGRDASGAQLMVRFAGRCRCAAVPGAAGDLRDAARRDGTLSAGTVPDDAAELARRPSLSARPVAVMSRAKLARLAALAAPAAPRGAAFSSLSASRGSTYAVISSSHAGAAALAGALPRATLLPEAARALGVAPSVRVAPALALRCACAAPEAAPNRPHAALPHRLGCADSWHESARAAPGPQVRAGG